MVRKAGNLFVVNYFLTDRFFIFMVKTLKLQIMDIQPSMYERAMNMLLTELRIEEEAGRYSPDVGFRSYVFNYIPNYIPSCVSV